MVSFPLECCWISVGQNKYEFLCLTHYILPLGEDGPSQMALEDLAMFRAIPTCTVFYPSDAVSTERAVELSSNTKVGGHLVVACCPSVVRVHLIRIL